MALTIDFAIGTGCGNTSTKLAGRLKLFMLLTAWKDGKLQEK